MLRLQRRRTYVPFLASLAILAGSLIAHSNANAQTMTRSVTLVWTAPGDDGTAGRATKYDLRYSALPIVNRDTLGWWNKAAVVNMGGRLPSPAGAKDSVVIAGLAIGKKYFSILRASDEASNWSGFSNLATIDLTGGVTSVEMETSGAPKLVLGAPYPSPTRDRAQVSLELARSGPVSADVYDARGRLVQSIYSGVLNEGQHLLRWDGRSSSGVAAAAGVYWIRVSAQGVRRAVKLVVVH